MTETVLANERLLPNEVVPTTGGNERSGHAAVATHVASAPPLTPPFGSNGHIEMEEMDKEVLTSLTLAVHKMGKVPRIHITGDITPRENPAHYYAWLKYYGRAHEDLLKVRIQINNRLKRLERVGIVIGDVTSEHAALQLGQLLGEERTLNDLLTDLGKRHWLASWVEGVPGFSYRWFALLLGMTGPLDQYANPAKLWKFLGLHVTPEGTAARRRRGQPWTHTNCQFGHLPSCKAGCKTNHHPQCVPDSLGTAYNPEGRVWAARVADSLIKVDPARSHYRVTYDVMREYYLTDTVKHARRGPSGCPFGQVHRATQQRGELVIWDEENAEQSPAGRVYQCVTWDEKNQREKSAHVHRAACRKMIKDLLRDLWVAWEGQQPK